MDTRIRNRSGGRFLMVQLPFVRICYNIWKSPQLFISSLHDALPISPPYFTMQNFHFLKYLEKKHSIAWIPKSTGRIGKKKTADSAGKQGGQFSRQKHRQQMPRIRAAS